MEQNPNNNQNEVMDVDFNNVIAKIKEDTMDTKEIRNIISTIRSKVIGIIESCNGELTEQEVIEEFLEEYNSELSFRSDVKDLLFSRIITYRGYRDLLKLYRSDKTTFRNMMKKIKLQGSKECEEFFTENMKKSLEKNTGEKGFASKIAKRLSALSSSKKEMNLNLYSDKNMEAVLNNVMNEFTKRGRVPVEENVVGYMQGAKTIMEDVVTDHLIYIIHESMSWLNEYGFLDRAIDESNNELGELGLDRLKFKKRNPISEEYDKKGKRLKNKEDKEDVGIIDAYSKENLKDPEKYTPEDLLIMAAFWESQYWLARTKMSLAMSTIKGLNLFGDISKHKTFALDDKKIMFAMKRDIGLTYLLTNGVNITPQINEQYKKFLVSNGLESREVENDLMEIRPEVENLKSAITDVTLMECLILQQLREKNPKVKKWGILKEQNEEKVEEIIENQKGNEKKDKIIKIVIEHEELRGPIILALSEEYLKEFFDVENLDVLPEYIDGEKLDETYCSVTSKVILPVTPFSKKISIEEYKKDPTSYLKASLSGKPVKKATTKPKGGQPGGEAR